MWLDDQVRKGPAALSMALIAAALFLLATQLRHRGDSRSEAIVAADDVAVARAGVLASPTDALAWAALGDAQAAVDQLAAAEHAYETAIRLGARDGHAHARLGFLVYQRGQEARALGLLSAARSAGAQVPMLDYTIATLERSLQPADSAPRDRPLAVDAGPLDASGFDASVVGGRPPPVEPPPLEPDDRICSVPLLRPHGRRTFRVQVAIDGVQALLILDTGASMTVLTSEFASRIGARLDHRRSIRALTANGWTTFASAVVGRVGLGGRVIEDVTVAVCNDCGLEDVTDGLLGLDLMAALRVEPVLSTQQLRFADCD